MLAEGDKSEFFLAPEVLGTGGSAGGGGGFSGGFDSPVAALSAPFLPLIALMTVEAMELSPNPKDPLDNCLAVDNILFLVSALVVDSLASLAGSGAAAGFPGSSWGAALSFKFSWGKLSF